MLEVTSSILTVIGTAWLCFILSNYVSFCFEDGIAHEAPIATLLLSVIAIGLSFTLLISVGYERIFDAYNIGALWESPYVLHIPTASEFWLDYLPDHWNALRSKAPSNISDLDLWGIALLAVGIALLMWSRFCKKGQNYAARFSFRPIITWALVTCILVFCVTQILLFLASYALGTFMFVGSLWKIVIGLIVLGCLGGGTVKLYDEHGKHVADLRR